MPDISVVDTPADDQPEGDAVLVGYDALVALRRDHHVPAPAGKSATLAERFLLPPFSVLDARQGYWQKRKRAWLAIGIQSELGRGSTATTSARVGPDDEATYRTIGGKAADNGLLGFSEQARSHYKGKANATPGGSPLPAATLKGGKTQRGDGRGRPLAQTYGSSGGPGDLAAGFKDGPRNKKANAMPSGGGGGGWAEMNEKMAASRAALQAEALGKVDNRVYKDHEWLLAHGKKVLQMGVQSATHDDLAIGSTCDAYRKAGEECPPAQSGTSIFDPVICELAYRWFTPVGGRVLDPFAGGSVRGIVAARLGRGYVGLDLRPEQCEANRVQADLLCPGADLVWHAADSTGVDAVAPGEYDGILSCPPYADLERYSDDPRDISTMSYDDFLAAYRVIIAKSCAMLKNDRFAVFVVGDLRDKAGMYRGFVLDTVLAFRAAGLELYNDCILVTAVGSLPIRVGKQFDSSRKLGKTHQNVLVFVKGDPVKATAACGKIDMSDLDMPDLWQAGTLAIPTADLEGVDGVDELLAGRSWSDGGDAVVLDAMPGEAALVCDVLRARARAAGQSAVRVYVAREGSWEVVPDAADLCYVSEDRAWLNAELFPDAERPVCDGDAVPLTMGDDAVEDHGPGLVGE